MILQYGEIGTIFEFCVPVVDQNGSPADLDNATEVVTVRQLGGVAGAVPVTPASVSVFKLTDAAYGSGKYAVQINSNTGMTAGERFAIWLAGDVGGVASHTLVGYIQLELLPVNTKQIDDSAIAADNLKTATEFAQVGIVDITNVVPTTTEFELSGLSGTGIDRFTPMIIRVLTAGGQFGEARIIRRSTPQNGNHLFVVEPLTAPLNSGDNVWIG